MDVSALFNGLKNVFGESRYENIKRNWQRFAYRNKDSACMFPTFGNFPGFGQALTDEEIIDKHLSKLTYDELNAIDENGVSILHLAVQYNRGGQTDHPTTEKETNKNIVKWLLENPAFNQEDAKGKFSTENYERNPPRGNAFHLAFAAQIPRGITFYSENHGGQFGNTFVASKALESMLNHENFARAYVNSCNGDGQSVLEYALRKATGRLHDGSNIL
jgi:ankyrin repeat protein